MNSFLIQLILSFSMSFGMLIGGSLLGSLGSLLAGGYPATTMMDLAERLRIWSAVASLGGTFSTIRMLESILWQRQLTALTQQTGLVIAAFGGAHLGHALIHWVVQP